MRLRYRRQAIVKLGIVVVTLIIVVPLIVHHFDRPADEEDPEVVKKKLRVGFLHVLNGRLCALYKFRLLKYVYL